MDDEDGKGRNFITTSVGKGMLVTMLVICMSYYWVLIGSLHGWE